MLRHTLGRVARRLRRAQRPVDADSTAIEARGFSPDELPLELDPAHLLDWRAEGHPHRLVDVRRLEEVRSGLLPGAELVPEDQMLARVAEFSAELPLVVFCEEGSRSDGIVSWLRGEGYSLAQSLDGGLRAWRAAGGTIEEPPRPGPDGPFLLGDPVRIVRSGITVGGAALLPDRIGAVQWIERAPDGGTRYAVAIDDAAGRWNLVADLRPSDLSGP